MKTETISNTTFKIEVPKCDVRDCLKDATVNRQDVTMEYRIVDGEYMQPGRSLGCYGINEHYCDDHA